MVEPRVQSVAPFLSLRQMLEQKASRGPMPLALHGGEPDQARDLLGLGEIALRRLAEILALQRHDPLITFVRHRLVEGDRQISVAEQLLQRRLRGHAGEPLRVMAHVTAQLPPEIVADEKVDDPAIGLRLQRQLALRLLQKRPQQRRQGERLGQQFLDHRRIVVAGENRIQHRSQTGNTPTGVARGDRDAERDVRCKLDCRHEGKIGLVEARHNSSSRERGGGGRRTQFGG